MAVDKIKPANGTKGILIRLAGDLGYAFRVYKQDGSFKDYDILHYDMSIIINDDDAYFYEDSHSNRIDHSPETLGHTK